MSILIGLTGPTGAGKSSATAVCAKFGLCVIACDLLARRAVEKGTAGLAALTEAFGEEILLPGGALDRKALAAEAFSSPERTELLNRVLLPHISRLVIAEAEGKNALLDAPTLFESGLDKLCTATVAVTAERGIRRARIIARDGLTAEQADLRLNAGKTDEYYKKRADFLIYNNGDENAFLQRFSDIIEKIYGGNENGR